jgi:hypothetical protein
LNDRTISDREFTVLATIEQSAGGFLADTELSGYIAELAPPLPSRQGEARCRIRSKLEVDWPEQRLQRHEADSRGRLQQMRNALVRFLLPFCGDAEPDVGEGQPCEAPLRCRV